jgi:hypothetical protein
MIGIDKNKKTLCLDIYKNRSIFHQLLPMQLEAYDLSHTELVAFCKMNKKEKQAKKEVVARPPHLFVSCDSVQAKPSQPKPKHKNSRQ